MASEANKGVYNFLINMSINFKSTSKTSAVIGNTLKKVKKDFDNLVASASANSNTVTSEIKQVAGATTEAAKRASYFDTVWGKAFGIMMKVYTIRFFGKAIIDLGTAIYNATTNTEKFNQRLLGMYGNSTQGVKALKDIDKYVNKYGISLDRAAEIMKKTSRNAKDMGVDITEALIQMNQSNTYGEDTVNSIITAFERMRNTGKVSIDDMNAMAENGLYVWEELKDKLHLNDKQLRNIEKSSIDVNDVMKVLSEYIVKAGNESTKTINSTTTAIGRLKNDFNNFTKLLFGNIGKDNIFTKIIDWCDSIIKKMYKILQISIDEKTFQENYKEYEKISKKPVEQLSPKDIAFLTSFSEQLNAKIEEMSPLLQKIAAEIQALIDKGIIPENEVFKKEGEYSYKSWLEKLLDNALKSISGKTDKDSKKLRELLDEYFKGNETYQTLLNDLLAIKDKLKAAGELGKIKEDAPTVISHWTSGVDNSDIIKIEDSAERLLKELLYNIENQLINSIDGIVASMEKYIPQDEIAKLFSIGIVDATNKDDVVSAFDSISERIIKIMNLNIALMETYGVSSEEILKYQLEAQEKIIEIEKQKHEYIMQWLNNELQKAVELANKQNEANKNNKFYQTLLAMNEFFESVKKEIIIIDDVTGESVKEIVDTGIPKVKSSILETLNYFKNLLSNVFTNMSLGNMTSSYTHLFGELFSMIGGSIGGFVSNLIGNFSNLMLGSLFSALSQIPGIMALLDPLSYMLQVVASYILPTLNDLLSPLIGFITTLAIMIANAIIPALNAIMPFMQAIAGVLASVLTLIEPILYAVGLLLNVVIKTFLMPFTIVLQILIPIINAFIPVFKLLAKVIWFVGFVVNGIAVGIVSAINVLILTINTFLKWIGAKQIALLAIPTYTSYEDFNEQLEGGGVSVGEMVGSASNPTNSVSTSGSGSNNYTTSSQRPLNLNIYVENWFGDMTATRKLALIVKNEFEILGVL